MDFLQMNTGRVLIRPKANEKTAGGIIVPTTLNTTLLKGDVVLAGDPPQDAGYLTSLRFLIGADVLFESKGALKVMGDNNEELMIVRHEDVLAVVK